MLLRLLLALMIAQVALVPMPAMAGCHPAPQAAAVPGHAHHLPAPPEPARQTAAEQLCMGCIAPATIRAPQLAAPAAHGLALALPIRSTGQPLAAPAPDTPPPRTEA